MSCRKKPNILLIMTDEQKFDAISGLSQIPDLTPNLRKLAEDGTCFSNAYTPSPVCGPARAAIFTGLYPPSCGAVKNWAPFAPGVSMLPARLQSCGYETASIGKLHFVPAKEAHGFEWKRLHDAPYSVYADDDKESDYIGWLQKEHFRETDPVLKFDEDELAFHTDLKKFMMGSGFRTEEQHDIAWCTKEAVGFLENRRSERPFFLSLSYFAPHMPYDPPSPYNTLYPWEDITLPESFYTDFLKDGAIFSRICAELRARIRSELSEKDAKQVVAAYLGQVKMLDDYLGRVIEALKKSGEYDNTMIVFTADHGDHMGSYGLFFKGQMYDSCCKVPLVIKPAGLADHVAATPLVVNTLDLYGTFLSLAGDDAWQSAGRESRSLLPLLCSASAQWDDKTYSIIGGDPDEALTMLRHGSYKLCRLAKNAEEAYYELFDLEADPQEHCDVSAVPAYEKVFRRLKADLDAWFYDQHARYPKAVTTVRSENYQFNGIKHL